MPRGAELVLRCLRQEGVDLVFGYPGGAIMPLYDALEGSGIRHVLSRHEQGAVFAAEGYARVSGKVGVAFATSGPGATNLVTGIADAKMDGVPLVCITGQVRSTLIGTDAFQETDVFGVTLALTKWSRLVTKLEDIPAVIAEGFYWARSGRPGPVVIDIPVDLMKAAASGLAPAIFLAPQKPQQQKPHASQDWTQRVVALLQSAQKPVALVGAGVKLAHASDKVRALLDDLKIPSFATVHGLGAIDPAAPHYLGMVGMHGTRAANLALHETDLLLVLGARLDDRVTGEPSTFAPYARIVHFEIDPSQLDRVRPCEVPVVGNLAETIPALHLAMASAPRPDWSEWLATAAHEDRGAEQPTGLTAPATQFLDDLFAMLPPDSIVVTDVGQHQMWAAQRFRGSNPRGFLTSGGLGAMGFGLPAAIGAQLAAPGSTVLCVSGDGGIQMNIQELATIHRAGAPIKILIVDNQYLGMVRQWQGLFYERNYAETDLSDNPDFVGIAKAYGIDGRTLGLDCMNPENTEATAQTLREFVRSPKAELLVFHCPREANVWPMVPAGAALNQMMLRDKEPEALEV